MSMKEVKITVSADEALANLFATVRKSGMTFTKCQAEKLLGGRRTVERLVRKNVLNTNCTGENDNSRWNLDAEQVLRLACNT